LGAGGGGDRSGVFDCLRVCRAFGVERAAGVGEFDLWGVGFVGAGEVGPGGAGGAGRAGCVEGGEGVADQAVWRVGMRVRG